MVSIPHYGSDPIPGVTRSDYSDPTHATFPNGYTDMFAAEVYGGLHEAGATVLATPYSRLFVDVNRRRDDFELERGAVRSKRGVFRTHTVTDTPVFARPMSRARAEALLSAYYDPYHRALRGLLDELLDVHGRVLLVDSHTGSARGMGEHQIIIGTRRGSTTHPILRERSARIFADHGFRPHHDVPGYAGGHIVRTFGAPRTDNVHAIQVEINTSLVMASTREAFVAALRSGRKPPIHEANLARLRRCVRELVVDLSQRLVAAV